MPIPNLIRTLSNRRPTPTLRDQQLASTTSKTSFTGLRLDVQNVCFRTVHTSTNLHSSTITHENVTYTVPKMMEPCVDQGNLRMMLWEMEDEFFEGRLAAWRGWYAVWYVPGWGAFWLTKMKEGGGFVDLPVVEERDACFWFRREMSEVRDKLTGIYGR